jgi:archaemetzincin
MSFRSVKNTVFLTCLYGIVCGSGIFLLGARSGDLTRMKPKIILAPIGDIEESVLDVLEKDLAATFSCQVERRDPIPIPEGAFHPARKQYRASLILKMLPGQTFKGKRDIGLAIADVDLYAEGLNFVFGQAEFGGPFAIISISRLRQSFYSLPENRAIFLERTIKEAVHELGHVFGLEHCPDPECVMHFSNSLSDTDRKSASFCSRCRARLDKLIK